VRLLIALAGVLVPLLHSSSAAALSLEPNGEFESPTYVTSDPEDADRLFVVEQGGRIQVRENGTTTPFLDIDAVVRSADEDPGGGEEGLFSIAFAPDFETSGLFYVYYTDTSSDIAIAELDANEGGAIEDTLRPVLGIPHPGQQNHNGGQLQFGPDGYLYAATGDGGGGNDPNPPDAQSLDSRLGKLLRIDPRQSGADPYMVPEDNPFTPGEDCVSACAEVWAYGLRNPWRFSFDRETGALVIADVGQNAWEEVDYEPAPQAGRGVNFGWDCREGAHAAASAAEAQCQAAPLVPFTDPIFEYEHPGGANRSITGGYVARDPDLGDLYGRYLYVDLFLGDLRSLCPAVPVASGDRSEGLDVDFPTSFGEDAAGRVYVAERGGTVYRLTGAAEPGACPSSPPPPPGRDMPPDDPPVRDHAGPRLELDGKSRRRVGSTIAVAVSTDEEASVALEAGGAGAARRKIGLRDKGASLDGGETERVKWRLSIKEERRVRRALDRGRKAAVRITAEATDASGNASDSDSLTVKLR